MSRSASLPIVAFCALALVACGDADRAPPSSSAHAPAPSGAQPTLEQWLPEGAASAHGSEPAGAAQHGAEPARPRAPRAGLGVRGTVTETMDSGGYTYMLLDTADGPVWIASTRREVVLGTTIQASGTVMSGFRSSTLDRTFDRLVLASRVEVVPAP